MTNPNISYDHLYQQYLLKLNETESFDEPALLALFCDFCKEVTGFKQLRATLEIATSTVTTDWPYIMINTRGVDVMKLEIAQVEQTDPFVRLNSSQIGAIQSFGGLIYHRYAHEKDMHRMRKSERIFKLTFEQVGSGTCHTDLAGYILDANQKFCDIIGYSKEEALGLRIKDLTHPDDWAIDVTFKERLFRYEIPYFSMEKRYFRKDGTLIWVYITVALMKSDSLSDEFLIGVVQDISERKAAELLLKSHADILEAQIKARTQELEALNAQLQQTAIIDPLTNLYNRRFLLSRMEGEKARSKRSGAPFCIILCDIDHFKMINDQMGHDCGDEVLIEISKTLLTGLRETDTLARWGGEEFLILLPDTSVESALALCTRLKETVSAHLCHYKGRDFFVTMTFGISAYNLEKTLQELIISADRAMYRGKHKGRNCVEC